ncbi:MAG: hypothetical protein NVS4B8_00960 [Herpetosiphon sp.]
MPSNLLSLISAAVTPIVLVTATSILLSNHTAKYNAISLQMRLLSAEYRAAGTPDVRRTSLHRQLILFQRRIRALGVASTCLYLALLCFLGTELAVIFVSGARVARLDVAGAITLVIGLLLMVLTVLLELQEVRLARHTGKEELRDVVR